MNKTKKTKKELRKFGLVMAAALVVVGSLLWWRVEGDSYLYVFGCAGVLLALGVAWPLGLRPLEYGWSMLGAALGWLNLRILLSAVYILVFTPVGLVFKLLGKDPLDRKMDREAKTYWKDRKAGVPDPSSYERQH